jgi:hypothetical protein
METVTTPPPQPSEARATPAPAPADNQLMPGMVLLDGGSPAADGRALALLGCRDAAGLAASWPDILERLQAAGLAGTASAEGTAGAAVEIDLAAAAGGARRLRVTPVPSGHGGGILMIQDAEIGRALESNLRDAMHMRSLAEIAPAVAHDLRAPINAMVLNLEVLRQTLAGSAAPAAVTAARNPRERQERYVHVLSEELTRLHKSLEILLAHISPRGEHGETFDLREAAQELAALLRPPARKQLTQVEVLAPDRAMPVCARRYLLRQALLHAGLAALGQVSREGALEIKLERIAGHARLRIVATALQSPRAEGDGGGGLGGAAAAGNLSAHGGGAAEARLEVARSILSQFGGTLRALPGDPAPEPEEGGAGLAAEARDRAAAPRTVCAYEVDLPLSESN